MPPLFRRCSLRYSRLVSRFVLMFGAPFLLRIALCRIIAFYLLPQLRLLRESQNLPTNKAILI